MDSGIYIYTFANGDNYVGQAISIQNRWNQHIDKMQKGKHTKRVQEAYNKYGEPTFQIVVRCHPHYLDALEAIYIYILKPTLNSMIPATYATRSLDMDISSDILERSLYDNIDELQRLRQLEEETEVQLVELEAEKRRLERRVVLVAKESQPKELQEYIHQLEEDAGFLATQLKISESVKARQYQQLKAAEERIYQHNRLPWYKRIFHTV